MQISKGCIIFSSNCHSYYIGGKSLFLGNISMLEISMLIGLMRWSERSLYNVMINENGLEQLISRCTTDSGALIDHLCASLIEENVQAGTLETYFSDHKAIWASVKVKK